jgi:hypothetical protein
MGRSDAVAAVVLAGWVLAGCPGDGGAAGEGSTPGDSLEMATASGESPLVLGDPIDLLAAEAAEGVETPLVDIPEPPGPGVWRWHEDTFTALTRVAIVKRADGLARAYCVVDDAASPTELPAGALEFVDHGRIERKLLRLDRGGCAGVPGPPPEYPIELDDDLGEEVLAGTAGRRLRRVSLSAGSYVYADWTTRWFREEASYFVVR